MAKPILPLDDPDPALNPTSRHRHARRPATFPAPSPAALSVLAGIVANSAVAAAGPAPFPFLCPTLARPPTISTPLPAPIPALSHRSRSRRSDSNLRNHRRDPTLPPKFEQGHDGVWRHVDNYTLYGSTVCSQTCRQPVTVDDVTSSPNPTDGTDVVELSDTLPSGWYPPPEKNEDRTTLILSLSLVLAFFICFFMIGCLFWRKNVRKRYKNGDIEMKARQRRRSPPAISPSILEEERRAKTKQKIWARATARWKDHARYAARLRRGKRPTSVRSQPLGSTTTLNPPAAIEIPAGDAASSTASLTPTQSRSVSRRPSSISLQESSTSSIHESSHDSSASPSLAPHITHDVPSSPPAYRRGTLLTPIAIPTEGFSMSDEHSSAHHVPSPRPSHISFDSSSFGTKSSIQPQEPESSHSHVHAAHVATDDKALLARLAGLAEHPPDIESVETESSHQVSVPVWEDEQLPDFARMSDLSDTDTSGPSSQCPFPPPPSKGKMAESSFYAYRYSFAEFSESIDPEQEPSAPPFEAPGLGDMVMLPSAPPLVEDESHLEVYPNAPQFETLTEGDDTQDAAAVDSQRSAEHQSSANSRPPSGGTLPGYHP